MTPGTETSDPVTWAEDWAALPPAKQAEFTAAIAQLRKDFTALGGPDCCGGIPTTTSFRTAAALGNPGLIAWTGWHRPWCTAGPVRHREPPLP
jgi:hypothetical protein